MDEEVKWKRRERRERPQAGARKPIFPMRRARKEEAREAAVHAVVDPRADPAPRSRRERRRERLAETDAVLAGAMRSFAEGQERELRCFADRRRTPPRAYAHEVANPSPEMHERFDLARGGAVTHRVHRDAGK